MDTELSSTSSSSQAIASCSNPIYSRLLLVAALPIEMHLAYYLENLKCLEHRSENLRGWRLAIHSEQNLEVEYLLVQSAVAGQPDLRWGVLWEKDPIDWLACEQREANSPEAHLRMRPAFQSQ
jgi:hypothetical protein